MAWYRVGGGGLPPQIKTDMNNVLNKKFGTSTTYPPTEWADDVNLMGMLEEKTQASAPVCSFEDGADNVPIKSWEVEIAPTLTGKSAIECTKSGKNLLDTAIAETKTHNSVSITCDGNGKYTATGTATGGSANITFTLKTPCTIESGMYLHLMNSGASGSVSITLQKQDNTTIYAPALSPANRIADLSSYVGETIYSIRFYVANGASFEMTLTPMLCYSNTATSFEPYTAPTTHTASLGRTIYGGEVDIVNGTGTATWKKIVADGVNVKATGGYASGANRLPTIQVSDAVTTSTDIKADYLTTTSSVIGTEDTIMLGNSGASIVLHIGTMQGNDGTHGYSSDAELLLACNSYLADHNLTIVYKLSDANATDFTFTPITPTPETALGVNNFWSDSGDTEVTYRASGTITPVPVVPTLISKTITENGTYDAEDDDADGYSSVTVNVSSVPSGDHDDPLGIMTDYTRFNVSNLYSAYYIGNGELKKEVVFQMASATGYEGFCISLDDLGLTNGTQYTLSFVLNVPTGVTFSGSYPWGIKYSSARVPTSGSANTNTFNITPDVDFVQQTGTQNVSITFTASSTNYLVVLLSRLAGSITSWFKMRDIQIEEVTP